MYICIYIYIDIYVYSVKHTSRCRRPPTLSPQKVNVGPYWYSILIYYVIYIYIYIYTCVCYIIMYYHSISYYAITIICIPPQTPWSYL